jgi:hypothetical protein
MTRIILLYLEAVGGVSTIRIRRGKFARVGASGGVVSNAIKASGRRPQYNFTGEAISQRVRAFQAPADTWSPISPPGVIGVTTVLIKTAPTSIITAALHKPE